MMIKALKTKYERARRFASQRMELVEELQSIDPQNNRTALETFITAVLSADPDPIVRHEAAFVLGKLKARGCINGRQAVRALCAAARYDASLVVRHEATESLYCFDGQEVEETLQLLHASNDSDIRATAAITLQRRSGFNQTFHGTYGDELKRHNELQKSASPSEAD